MRALAEEGVTHLVTLLSAREGAAGIGEAVGAAGLGWLWLPLENADPPAEARDSEIRAAFDQVRGLLGSGARVLIHCSAGIHRTGLIGYALLRYLGQSADQARDTLRALRDVTAEGVGGPRLGWGDRFVLRCARAAAPPTGR